MRRKKKAMNVWNTNAMSVVELSKELVRKASGNSCLRKICAMMDIAKEKQLLPRRGQL